MADLNGDGKERFGLLTRIAATENVSSSARMKS
jgi:hypothetical protein